MRPRALTCLPPCLLTSLLEASDEALMHRCLTCTCAHDAAGQQDMSVSCCPREIRAANKSCSAAEGITVTAPCVLRFDDWNDPGTLTLTDALISAPAKSQQRFMTAPSNSGLQSSEHDAANVAPAEVAAAQAATLSDVPVSTPATTATPSSNGGSSGTGSGNGSGSGNGNGPSRAFTIQLFKIGNTSAKYDRYFQDAAARWEGIITQSLIPFTAEEVPHTGWFSDFYKDAPEPNNCKSSQTCLTDSQHGSPGFLSVCRNAWV